MKFLCRLSLILALIFFVFTFTISIINLNDYYIFVGGINNNVIFTSLALFSILFFAVFLFLNFKHKWHIMLSVALLFITGVIVMTIGFLPEYRYNQYISDDAVHKIIVEEKNAHTDTSIYFYEETSSPFYKLLYIATIENAQKATPYQYGDYTVSFEEKHLSISIPLYSESPCTVMYAK